METILRPMWSRTGVFAVMIFLGQSLSQSTLRSTGAADAGHLPVQSAATHSDSGRSVLNTPPVQDKPQIPSGNVHFLVVIDAGHGGEDAGARFSDKLFEKEITLSVARKLRSELQKRGVPAALLRDSDSTLSYDQRAVITNAQRAGLYVGIHAGIPGNGVRVYTVMLPAREAMNGLKNGENKNGPFISWRTAQAGSIDRSLIVAGSLVAEFTKAQITTTSASAPLLPLNQIAAPAVAVEISPPQSSAKPDFMTNAKYQQAITAAMAAAIAEVRAKIGEHP